jgi:hypothetical protein
MDLSDKEKAAYVSILKKLPAAKATRIWNLYLAIRAGRKRVVADLNKEERRDVVTLWEAHLIRYESVNPLGKPISVTLSALPYRQMEGE